jgi:hypothetical protein
VRRSWKKGLKLPVMAITAAAVLSLALVGSATANGRGASIERFPVSFVISSATCPNLSDGASVDGSGIEKSITIEKQRAGVTTVINTSHAHGTATDQDGNTYVFNYSNHFRVSNTVGSPDIFRGKMSDSFSLSGPGPEKLHNGFLARFTTDFSSLFTFQPIHSRGDPLSFPDGAAQCDPL